MYKETQSQLAFVEDFFLPFGGKLRKDNRWVTLAEIIPWWKAEKIYAKSSRKKFKGEQAFSVRVALGSLIIQERMGFSDRETVLQIQKNPYLQYFLGMPAFEEKPPFHHSLMTHFRKRLGPEIINKVNEWIVLEEQEQSQDEEDGNSIASIPPQEERENAGKLLLDATCAPADIAYPTDLGLLNEAREKLEHIIDVLHEEQKGKKQKPRTYRKKARKEYLSIAKQRKAGAKKIRKAVGKQLGYVRRDLAIIEELSKNSSLSGLGRKEHRDLLVISELYRQQEEMYRARSHSIEHRIVSIS